MKVVMRKKDRVNMIKSKPMLVIVLLFCLIILTACDGSSPVPDDTSLSSVDNVGQLDDPDDTKLLSVDNLSQLGDGECAPAHAIKTTLQNSASPVIDEELVALFFNYYIEDHQYGGPYHSYELRLLPNFAAREAPDWDQLTQFVFMMSTQVERDYDGTYTLSKKGFEETVDRFFADIEYSHDSSAFLHLVEDTYTPTGWGIHDSVYYRLYELSKIGEDTFRAAFDGFWFWEEDGFSQPYDEVSENMRAVMDYVEERKLEGKKVDIILKILQDPHYSELLKKGEHLEITFKLSSEPEYAFTYLSGKRTAED